MSDNSKVRTRFAPSPTGYLHLGSIRTALFCYLFAKSKSGQFVWRLEDTDQERFVSGAEAQMRQVFDWLGIAPDEGPEIGGEFGPYRQSERLKLYQRFAHELVDQGLAYYSDLNQAVIEEAKLKAKQDKRSFVFRGEDFDRQLGDNRANVPIRFRMSKVVGDTVTWKDSIRGEQTVNLSTIEDFILIKSDGYPTYNFANVIDDHLMQVSDVIRAEEFIASTPKHQLLYQSLGFAVPNFLHLPIVLGEDKKKLSKRSGASDLMLLKHQGYLPNAIVNYLALLGWNPGSTQEVFSLSQLVAAFNPKSLQVSPAIYNQERLDWFNTQHLRMLGMQELVEVFKPLIKDYFDPEWEASRNFLSNPDDIAYLERILTVEKDKITNPKQYIDKIYFLYRRPKFDQTVLDRFDLDKADFEVVVERLLAVLESNQDWEKGELINLVKGFIKSSGLSTKFVMMSLRASLTSQLGAMGIYDIMVLLGRQESLARLNQALEE
ncbi:glutamate--tRNA ligase [Candidatus Saccharibacteria bacterium]|nr:glutamate--tRNA ligase [Candidatus Saccharibacteria bacterium]MCB9834967.1 glutamate--tRNA ligase [Candidatus Nomurabacteria bacterium]